MEEPCRNCFMKNPNNLEKIFAKTTCGKEFAKGYLENLMRCLKELDLNQVEKIIELFDQTRLQGQTIFFIGNGGSAATCSHFANDLMLLTRGVDAIPYQAISLCDNVALITAIANDCGFEKLFVQQLQNLAKKGDLLVAISASGKSKNLIEAVQWAGSIGLNTIGLAGFDGGGLKSLCQEFLYLPSKEGEYGPPEDMALILDHLITTFLAYRFYGKRLGFRPEHQGYQE